MLRHLLLQPLQKGLQLSPIGRENSPEPQEDHPRQRVSHARLMQGTYRSLRQAAYVTA